MSNTAVETEGKKQNQATRPALTNGKSSPDASRLGFNRFKSTLSAQETVAIAEIFSDAFEQDITADDIEHAQEKIAAFVEQMDGRVGEGMEDLLALWFARRAPIVDRLNASGATASPDYWGFEIGSLFGGSAAISVLATADLDATAKFVLIDPLDGYYGQAVDPVSGLTVTEDRVRKNLLLAGANMFDIHVLTGLSEDPHIIQSATQYRYLCGYIDGDHTYLGIHNDWFKYTQNIDVGGYVIVDNYHDKHSPEVSHFVDGVVLPELKDFWQPVMEVGQSLILKKIRDVPAEINERLYQHISLPAARRNLLWLQRNLSDAKTRLGEREAGIQHRNEAIEGLKKENQNLKKKIEALTDDSTKLKTLLHEAQHVHGEQERTAERDVAELKTDIIRKEDKIAALTERLDFFKSVHGDSEAKTAKVEAKLQALGDDKTTREVELAKLTERSSWLEQERSNLLDTLKHLKNELTVEQHNPSSSPLAAALKPELDAIDRRLLELSKNKASGGAQKGADSAPADAAYARKLEERNFALEEQFMAPRILLPQLVKATTVRTIEHLARITPGAKLKEQLVDKAQKMRGKAVTSESANKIETPKKVEFAKGDPLPAIPETHEAGPARHDRTFFVNYTFGGKTRYLPRQEFLRHTTRAGQALAQLKDKFRGERCFIIGNGPSLNRQNLFQLKDEFTIGSNYIYMNHDKMGFHPSILSFANHLVIQQRLEEIINLEEPVKALPFYLFKEVGAPKRSMVLNMQHQTPEFSRNASSFVSTQSTVTYVNLQLAYHLGFDEVYLIGVDNRYKQPKRGTEGTVLTQEEDDPNHFSPNYFKGLKWQKGDEEKMESLYARAKMTFEARGSKIVDCTDDGALTIFEKANLDAVVSAAPPPPAKAIASAKSKLRDITEAPQNLDPKHVTITVSPDLADRFGHHFNMDQYLQREAQKRGHALVSICSTHLEQSLADECNWLIPAIPTKTWWSVRNHQVIDRKVAEFREGVRKALRMVDLAYGEATPKTIFMYTGNLPLARALRDEIAGRKNIRIVVQHFYGAMMDLENAEILNETKKTLKDLLGSGAQLALGTKELVAHYEKKTGPRLDFLPGDPSCTFSDADVATMIEQENKQEAPGKEKRLRVLFTPNMNIEKGYLTAVEAARRICEDPVLSARIEPVVRFIPRHDTKPEAIEAAERLRANPKATIAEGVLSDEDFRNQFMDADIVVVPYTVKAFRHRMANSLTDAIYAGKPLVGTSGTYVGNRIDEYECGRTFKDGSADDLIRAISDVADNYETCLKHSRAARKNYFKDRSWNVMYQKIVPNVSDANDEK